jgi:hypothetical protein
MKTWVSLLLILVVIVLVSNRQEEILEEDLVSVAQLEDDLEEPINPALADSLLRIQATQSALATFAAAPRWDQDQTTVHYVQDASGRQVVVQLEYGFIIHPDLRHLMLSHTSSENVLQQIYAIKDGEIRLIGDLVTNTTGGGAVLKDITGDGIKDIVTRSHPSTKVRPFSKEKGVFASELELIHPCFSVSEKLVRLYELRGDDTLYYKLKWQDDQLLPVEYIYPHPDNAFWRLKTNVRNDTVQANQATVLWYLPKEYRAVAICAAEQ